MKILIALDTSPHSERALDFVTRMRWPAGSRVIVLSALQPPVNAVATGPYEPGVVDPQLLERQREQLENLVSGAERRLREAGFSTEGRVVVGDPREALMEAAQGERADLVVTGSHGRSGLSKLMLGSVSSHIVTHAPCSVLVVKTETLTPAGSGIPKGRQI